MHVFMTIFFTIVIRNFTSNTNRCDIDFKSSWIFNYGIIIGLTCKFDALNKHFTYSLSINEKDHVIQLTMHSLNTH